MECDTCPDGQLLASCSGPAFNKIGVTLSQQEIRPLALSSAVCTTSIWTNALVSCSASRKQGDTESSPRGPRRPRCPRKAQTRHWPQGDAASCAFFPLWHDGPRQGQGTSLLLQSVRIPLRLCCQTEQLNKCEGILSKSTSRTNDDSGLPKCLARVSVVQRLGVPSYEHLTSLRESTGSKLLNGSRSLRPLEPQVSTREQNSIRY